VGVDQAFQIVEGRGKLERLTWKQFEIGKTKIAAGEHEGHR